MGLPAGCYWYGEKYKCPSLPKWAFSLFQEQADRTELHQTPNDSVCEEQIQSDATEQRYDTSESHSSVNGKNLNDSSQLSRAPKAPTKSDVPLPATRKTRTRNIVLPMKYRDQPRCADNEEEG